MSFSDEESTRLRQAFRSLAPGAQARPDCPEPEVLLQAASGELKASDSQDLIDHLSGCPSCAEDWRLAHELVREPQSSVARFTRKRLGPGSYGWLAAAAVLVLLIALPLWRAARPNHQPGTVRAPGQATEIRSLVPEGEILSRESCVLRWSSATSSATTYSLLVSNEAFEVLLRQGGLQSTEYQVPSEVLQAVPPGGKILWQIEAVGPTGHSVVSPTFVQQLE